MAVEDNFPDAELGQCLNEQDAVIVSCEADETITKGLFVALADSTEVPFHVVIAKDAKAFGVALKDAESGDIIPVAVDNAIVKMEYGTTAACTAGTTIRPDGDGNFEVAAAADNALAAGVALQSMDADGDKGLIFVKCNAQVAPA